MEALKIVFIVMFIFGWTNAASNKSPCEGCRDLVDGLLKGLDKTLSKNFGGGDVDWEEKRNLKYKTSELRLVEIIETACSKDNFQCNKILEEHEDDIETWYKKQQVEPISLQDFLCVETVQACCPENKFGENCEDCPTGDSNEICYGKGKCEGSGDKQGSGKCICDDGYSGELCNECADKYFKDDPDASFVCAPCHETCQTCKGGNATDCETCRAGYREETNTEKEGDVKCVDLDECVEQKDLCPVGQYCVNTEGSYKCEEWKCHPMCERCYGPTHANCFSCKQGVIMRQPFVCQDINECASGAICMGMYEVCVNTIGHYKCECARFFRRDSATQQCQPDPSIYSRYIPDKLVKKAEKKKEEEVKEEPKEEDKEEEPKEEGKEEKDESSEDQKDEETKEEL